MELLFKPLIFSHVAAGIVSLLTAPVAMTVAKGGKVHRFAGKIFFFPRLC
jgi:uncharacterized membrane protein